MKDTATSTPETLSAPGPGDDAPVLVTGTHRSGTTWVASMLALATGTVLPAREPFNVGPGEWALDGLATTWFQYAPALDQQRARDAVDSLLAGRARRAFGRRQLARWWPPARTRGRLIVKDPIAAVSSEWFADALDAHVVVLIRHPAAFANSLRRMDWRFDFDAFLSQPELMDEHLRPFERLIRERPTDIVGQAGVLWVCLNSVLANYAEHRPHWLVRRHEDLSTDPVGTFQDLYTRLGLDWDATIRQRIEEFTGSDNPVNAPPGVTHELRRDSRSNIRTWQRHLSGDEVRVLRELTEPVASRYYGDDDW